MHLPRANQTGLEGVSIWLPTAWLLLCQASWPPLLPLLFLKTRHGPLLSELQLRPCN